MDKNVVYIIVTEKVLNIFSQVKVSDQVRFDRMLLDYLSISLHFFYPLNILNTYFILIYCKDEKSEHKVAYTVMCSFR